MRRMPDVCWFGPAESAEWATVLICDISSTCLQITHPATWE